MIRTLYLMRHGIAAEPGPTQSDAERALTPDGARRVGQIARALRRLGVELDAIVSSPLRRAKETAELVLAEVDGAAEVSELPALAPGHSPAQVLNALRDFRDARHLLLVGHEPSLGHLASFILTGALDAVFEFKKGAVATLELDNLPPRHHGTLKWFVTPKQLRLIGRRQRH